MLDTQPVAGNTVHTQPENKAFFPALDGLRAFAFLLVFAHHYLKFAVGWVGVDIFFVLSGFLITGILMDTRDRPHRARNFYVRRTLRIFPLYYLVIVILVLLTPYFHWQWDWRWLVWPLYVGNWVLFVHRGPLDVATTYLYNGWLAGAAPRTVALIGHFWSLCVEEQFYLVWPWVVFYVRSRRALIAICSGIILLWPLLRHLADTWLPPDRVAAEATVHNTFFRLDTLMVGALVALLYRGSTREALFRASQKAILVACGITTAALAAFALYPSLLHNRGVKPALFSVGFTLIALISAVLIVRCLVPGTVFYRMFNLPALRWMGRISYGAYVFHDIPHALYASISVRTHIPVVVLGFAGTFAMAWLSFRFFESKFLDMKDRLTLPARG